MEGNTYARYKTTMLIAAGLFAVWGILSLFDVGSLTYVGYQTDGNNTVTQILEGGSAERAGMQKGDYIRSIGGIAVEDAAARARQARPRVGETRTLVVERAGQPVSLELTYASLPGTNKALTIATILMGFCFMIVGLIPYLKAPGAHTTLLALFGLTLGFSFFGGPSIDAYVLRTVFGIITTLLVVAGFATLLHFTLMFPRRKALLDKRRILDWLYGPAALVFLFLLYRGIFQPPATGAMNVITGILIGTLILGYFGLSLGAFIHSYVKASRQERRAQGLTYVLAGVLVGFLPILSTVLVRLVAPQVVIPGANFSFLTLVFIPVSLALAVMKSEKAGIPVSGFNKVPSRVSVST